MAGGRRVGAQPPSHVAYYVALGGVLLLLLLLCCYLLYYCVTKIAELSDSESLMQSSRPARDYPVQAAVREQATAMAKLCKLPAPPAKGDTVFPTSSSPGTQLVGTNVGPTLAPAIDARAPTFESRDNKMAVATPDVTGGSQTPAATAR